MTLCHLTQLTSTIECVNSTTYLYEKYYSSLKLSKDIKEHVHNTQNLASKKTLAYFSHLLVMKKMKCCEYFTWSSQVLYNNTCYIWNECIIIGKSFVTFLGKVDLTNETACFFNSHPIKRAPLKRGIHSWASIITWNETSTTTCHFSNNKMQSSFWNIKKFTLLLLLYFVLIF